MAVDKKIKLYIQAEIKEAEARLKKFVESQKNVKKENDKLKQSFVGLGKTIVSAFAVRAIANFSKESLSLKARADSLNLSFRNLGQGIGLNNESLEKFRKATNGTVSDIDLMIQANNAMLLGIVQNEDEFSELIDSAQRLAKAVGKDTLFGIESLTTGIGRQSRLMLDNLGIIVKAEDAYKAMAEATGKSVAALTDQERKQAFITATMESVRQKVADLGTETLDTNDTFNQLGVSMVNLKVAFGEFVEGPGVSFINFLTNFLTKVPIAIENIDGFIENVKSIPNKVQQAFDSIGKEQEPLFTYDSLVGPIQPTGKEKEVFDQVKDFYHEHVEAMKFIDEDYFKARQDLTFGDRLVQDAANKENLDAVKELRKEEALAHKQRIQDNLQSAILQGQSAKEAGISVVKAEIAEAQAGLISSIMKAVPFPLNLALAATAGSMVGKVTDQLFSSFATGGSIITKGRTTLPIGNGVMVGDNASGMERIDVTPLPAPPGANDRNINIYISAPLVDETVVDHIIPAIRRAEKLGL